jgi:hypothetical protein
LVQWRQTAFSPQSGFEIDDSLYRDHHSRFGNHRLTWRRRVKPRFGEVSEEARQNNRVRADAPHDDWFVVKSTSKILQELRCRLD